MFSTVTTSILDNKNSYGMTNDSSRNKKEIITRLIDELSSKINFAKWQHLRQWQPCNRINNNKLITRLNGQAISKLYTTFPKVFPCIFFVYWDASQGSGDIVFALKTAATLKDNFPNSFVFIQVPENDDIFNNCLKLCREDLKECLCKNSTDVIKKIQKFQKQKWVNELTNLLPKQNEKGGLTKEDIDRIINTTWPIIAFNVATPVIENHCFVPKTLWNYHIDEYNGWRVHSNKVINNESESDTDIFNESESDTDIFNESESDTDIIKCSGEVCSWHVAGVGFQDEFPALGIHLNPLLDTNLYGDHGPRRTLSNLQNLEDKKLKAKILENNTISKYATKRKLYFAYQSEGGDESLRNFVKNVVSLNKEEKEQVDFIIVSKSVTNVFKTIHDEFYDIATDDHTYTHVLYPLNQDSIMTLEFRGEKTLRILAVDHVSHHDMITLMQASEKIKHVSGDQSLAEALSFRGHVFFYQLQDWKKDFFKQLKSLACYMTSRNSNLVKFLKNCHKDNHNSLLDILKSSDFEEQLTRFQQKLMSWYRFDDWLVGAANRVLMKYYYKHLKDIENDDIDFNEKLNAQTLGKLYDAIQKSMKQHGNKTISRKRVQRITYPRECKRRK